MSKFSNLKLRYKIGVGVATGAVILGAAGGAFAYFTTNGSSTGTGAVGSTSTANDWTVAVTNSSTAMYPGGTADTLPFTITNSVNGFEGLQTIAVSVAPDAAHATAGCQASWYTVSVSGTDTAGTNSSTTSDSETFTLTAVDDIAHNGVYHGTVNLVLTDTGGNQNSCQGDVPVVTVTAG